MKKLLLLALVVCGGVMLAAADNVTKRIFVITDANFQTYQGSGLAVHAWYADNSGDLYNQGNDNEKMATFEGFNPSGAKGLWFKDITFDESKTIQFFVYKYGDTGWHSSDATQMQLNSSSAINYYSWDSNSNGALTNEGTVTYYAYLYDGTSGWTKQELTTTDNVTYTTTIDNQTSYNSDLEMIIAPSLAFDDDFSSFKWHMMYRPYSENQTVGFNNQINYGGGCYGGSNSNSLKLNAEANYELTFYLFDWKYSLAPSFERTITNTYSTFSSDYAVAVPSGLSAYYVATVGSGQVNMTKFASGIRSTDGAFMQIVTASSDNKYKFTPASTTDNPATNLLQPTSDGDIPANSYVFASGSNGLGFYKLSSALSGVGKGKAYLQAGNYESRLSIVFDGEASGISETEINLSTNGNFFDLQGRRVAQPIKGLYIVNGKKQIFK